MKSKSKTHKTPLSLVQRYTLQFPKVWDVLEKTRRDPAINDRWDHICYLPCTAAQAFLHDEKYGNLSNADASARCAELTGLYIWRKDKIIYRLDRELAEVLFEQAESMDYDAELPIELLLHLPHDCIYIQTDIIEGADGFFLWIEFDVNRNEFELRIQLVSTDFSKTTPLFLHLSGKTLQDCIEEGIQQTKRNWEAQRFSDPEFNKILEALNSPQFSSLKETITNYLDEFQQNQSIQLFAVQVILYLISENREVEPNTEQAQIYRPIPKNSKPKDKYREIQIEDVGVRIGATLRKYKQNYPIKKSSGSSAEKSGTQKRPHMRRGHWHHYWSGKKDGSEPRTLRLNWVAPTMIHEEQKNSERNTDIVTIFPVK